jgi:hypothetical protein
MEPECLLPFPGLQGSPMPDLVDRDIGKIDAALGVLLYRHFVEPPSPPKNQPEGMTKAVVENRC